MIEDHSKALLQFSGGKDSTALLYMARPWLDRIEVAIVDAGANFPHVQAHIERTCERLKVAPTIIRSDARAYVAANGLPADIVPVENFQAAPFMTDRPRLVPYLACCFANLMAPMADYVRESGHTLVLRGSKQADARVGAPDGFMADGVEYRSPLWRWSDAEVFAYLDGLGVELPDQYAHGVNDGLDCWFCPAHMAHGGKQRLDYIRARHPDLWPEVRKNVQQVAGIVAAQFAIVQQAYEVAA